MPNATDITVLETLQKLDAEFGAVAAAIENGEFALWVGSGISRKAPSLGDLIDKTMEFLRVKVNDAGSAAKFEPALRRALQLAGVAYNDIVPHLALPFINWPNAVAIRSTLWGKYSDLLDVRVQGEPDDYLLWEGMDIRAAFAHPEPPACAHLSIAVLILEGAVHEIVSANWDGFIEAAVEKLTGADTGTLQVVVDPVNLRDPPAKARLLKFHGCIVHATDDPAKYRHLLIGSKTRIVSWPSANETAAMRHEMLSVATKHKAIMVGLSLQDVNLQALFAQAFQAQPWPWPPAPNAQGHVFCDEELGEGHRQILKTVYANAYNDHIADIESSAQIRAWGEQVLLAMALKVITDKLAALLDSVFHGTRLAPEVDEARSSLLRIRDRIAGAATGDRTAFLSSAISAWSRLITVFRDGSLGSAEVYQPISSVAVGQIASDANAKAAGFGEMGVALSLLETGHSTGLWNLDLPANDDIESGVLASIGTWGGSSRPIFLVRSADVALKLKQKGAFANESAIVIHADSAWHAMTSDAGSTSSARTPSRAPGRTGKTGPTHVSIPALLGSSGDLAMVHQLFSEAITL